MNKINISLLADKLANNKWLINSTAHNNLAALIHSYIQNPVIPTYGEENEYQNSNNDNNVVDDNLTAIISVSGVLVKGASNIEEQMFGLIDTDYIRYCLEDAANDTNVKDIVLFFNSPGGETTGIEELGRKIQIIDKIKPVYAWTETMMCSAAYWLGSQCRSIGMTPSAIVGSIGVYSLIEDCSKALQEEGVDIQAISAGKYKLMGASFKPLTEEEKKILQEDVDTQHTKFKDAVLSRRTVSIEYMEGLTYEGTAAIAGNLVDVVVDELNQYLKVAKSDDLTTNHNIDMKEYKKVNIQSKSAEVAPIEKVAALPGVPINEVEPDTDGVGDEPKKDEGYECPHCGKKSNEPHNEPDTDGVGDEKKAEVVVPEVKAELSQNEQWDSLFGRKSVTNAFYESAIKHVLENSNRKY
jgi:signal peptide peptidase SppA